MRIFAIDPGPSTSGYALYDAKHNEVLEAGAKHPTTDIIRLLRAEGRTECVAIERCQAQSHASRAVSETTEWSAKFHLAATELWGVKEVHWWYRHRVTSTLQVTRGGRASDSLVRQRCLEHLDWSEAMARRRRDVSSHAWQALGLAIAVAKVHAT